MLYSRPPFQSDNELKCKKGSNYGVFESQEVFAKRSTRDIIGCGYLTIIPWFFCVNVRSQILPEVSHLFQQLRFCSWGVTNNTDINISTKFGHFMSSFAHTTEQHQQNTSFNLHKKIWFIFKISLAMKLIFVLHHTDISSKFMGVFRLSLQ